jgi:methylmalonyl-CoA mutase N-terminal domain/subunit
MHVEELTADYERRITARIAEIDARGEIRDLCEQGYFRGLFAAALVDRATEVEDGTRPVVGVNVHVIDPADDTLLRSVSEQRIEPCWEHAEAISAWKAGRSLHAVRGALSELEAVTREPGSNLMPALIAALDADCSFGECTGVMRVAHGDPFDPFGGLERP